MNSSISEIINKVRKVVHDHYMTSPEKPNVVIFMTDCFRRRLLAETSGLVSSQIEVDFNYRDGDQLAGYPVHTIISTCINPYFIFIDKGK